MTPTLYIKYQAIRTLSSPRRLVVLTFLMLLIAFSGLLVLFQNAPNAVTFNGDAIPVIRPIETEVCIGGAVHFATITETTNDEIPGRLEIDEAWCLEGLGGACKTVTPPNPSPSPKPAGTTIPAGRWPCARRSASNTLSTP